MVMVGGGANYCSSDEGITVMVNKLANHYSDVSYAACVSVMVNKLANHYSDVSYAACVSRT